MRASFLDAPRLDEFEPTTLEMAYSIAKGVLDVESDYKKMGITFNLCYTHFMHVFCTKESAFALSNTIFQSVVFDSAKIASKEEMGEFISYFVNRMFQGEASASTVGLRYALGFEELVYDVCAHVVRKFRKVSNLSMNLKKKLELLRQCIGVVARLCAAVREYLPISSNESTENTCEWLGLATILEFAQGNCLNNANHHIEEKLNFLILYDEICANILDKEGSTPSANLQWVACSVNVQRILCRAETSRFKTFVPHCIEFKSRSDRLRKGVKRKRTDDDAGASLPDTPELTPVACGCVSSFEL
jgi:hypothetical protein